MLNQLINIFINKRSEFIDEFLEGSIVKSKDQKVPFTEKLDRIVTNRYSRNSDISIINVFYVYVNV